MTIERILLGVTGAFIIFIALAVIMALIEDKQWHKTHSRPEPTTRPPTSRPRGPAPEPPPTRAMNQPPYRPTYTTLVEPECKYCGRINDPGSRECQGCGANMGGKVRTPKPPPPLPG